MPLITFHGKNVIATLGNDFISNSMLTAHGINGDDIYFDIEQI